MKTWLDKTVDGKFRIEHVPRVPSPGAVDLSRPPVGVLHTTEGGSWDGLLAEFKQHFAPHFLVGPHRIAQLIPLGSMSASLEHLPGTLETNRWARAQIEVQASSREEPYYFDAKITEALASLMATLKVEALIPLSRPYPDQLPSKPWAAQTFARRKDGKWGKTAGWFGHIEVPGNAHWDPGALKWSSLLAAASKQVPLKLRPYYVVKVVAGRLVRVGK